MAKNHTANVEITPLTKEVSRESFFLVCEVFATDSVLHSAVGISIEDYRRYLQASFKKMWKQGLSLVAIDRTNDELVGCLVACDYTAQGESNAQVPPELHAVNALLRKLENIYRLNRQLVPGKYMLIDMAIVKPTVRGSGVYRKLRESAHQVGREAGFSLVVGELSSSATQHLCINRFGHKVCAEIEYASFQYMDETPFAKIKDPKSIVFVEGEL